MFVSAYACGSERDGTEREAFWNDLNDFLQFYNKYEFCVRRLNGCVGDEVVEDVVP